MDPDATIPVLSVVLTPATPADRQKLADALSALKVEDRTLDPREDHASGQVTISGTSEPHLGLIIDRLVRAYNVAAGVSRPQVICRPALTRTVDGEMKYARMTRAGGQYGHVVIRLSPRAPGTGYVFDDRVEGGSVPSRFVPAVDQGIREVLAREGFAGYPIADVLAELRNGSYHDADSNEDAFRAAAAQATRDALRQVDVVLLEPIMRVDATVPPLNLAEVVDHLVSSGGRVRAWQPDGATGHASALVPMAGLLGYQTALRSLTRGVGTCSIRFAGFAARRSRDDEEASPVGVLRPRPPHLRDSGIALPEPEEHDQE